MRNAPFVSIIIPAYNEAAMLEKSLSALNRINYSRDRYEIIVVDNGSTDNTCKIAEKYNVKVVQFPGGKTIASVRNRGASSAKGDVLAFLDADCVVTKNWLSNAVKKLADGIGVVGSRPFAPLKTSTWVQRCLGTIVAKSLQGPIFVDWLSSSNFIVRKELFNKVNGFDEHLETNEDAYISYRLNRITKIMYDPDVKAFHLREPRTLFDFLMKEIWHGKSLYKAVFRHGLFARELMSIAIPLFYLINLVFIIIGLIFSNKIWLISTIIFFSIPILMTIKCLSRINNTSILIQSFLINFIYILSRSMSVVYSIKDLLSRK